MKKKCKTCTYRGPPCDINSYETCHNPPKGVPKFTQYIRDFFAGVCPISLTYGWV